MGESAELTQIQHDKNDTVTFPNLNPDKRDTAPAASRWFTVGTKKVNQQAHSTPLKFNLQLKNRYEPLQEPTNATHAPRSPEMSPDGQCGKSQSPRRRAVHVSATVQQGPISEEADEPDTLIIGDSTIKGITDSREPTDLEQPTDPEQPARYHQERPLVLAPPRTAPPRYQPRSPRTVPPGLSPPTWPTKVSPIASPNDSLITPETMAPKTKTPKTMTPLPHQHTDIDDEYF
ncbi:unnamed protein product [Boreogadus saida]